MMEKNCQDDLNEFLLGVENFTSKRSPFHASETPSEPLDLSQNKCEMSEIVCSMPTDMNILNDLTSQIDIFDRNVACYLAGYLLKKAEEKYEFCNGCMG